MTVASRETIRDVTAKVNMIMSSCVDGFQPGMPGFGLVMITFCSTSMLCCFPVAMLFEQLD